MGAYCPSCGNYTKEPFDGSDWCLPCVDGTLDEQRRLRFAPELPEVVEYEPED